MRAGTCSDCTAPSRAEGAAGSTSCHGARDAQPGSEARDFELMAISTTTCFADSPAQPFVWQSRLLPGRQRIKRGCIPVTVIFPTLRPLRRCAAGMVRHLCGLLQRAAVFEIGRDSGRPEAVIADLLSDARGGAAARNHLVGNPLAAAASAVQLFRPFNGGRNPSEFRRRGERACAGL